MHESTIKYIATGFVAICGLYILYRRKKSKEPRHVGTVAELMIHPLKSCSGISVKT